MEEGRENKITPIKKSVRTLSDKAPIQEACKSNAAQQRLLSVSQQFSTTCTNTLRRNVP